MNLFNLGGFSMRNFAIVSILAGLFSWFVLHNTDATVFFGVAALIALVVVNHSNSTNNQFDEVYRTMDTNVRDVNDDLNGIRREHDTIYRYIDESLRDLRDAQRSKR